MTMTFTLDPLLLRSPMFVPRAFAVDPLGSPHATPEGISVNSNSSSTVSYEHGDPAHAHTTPELLCALWNLVTSRNSLTHDQRVGSSTHLFPNFQYTTTHTIYLHRLMRHLDRCKDVCDDFGVRVFVTPKMEEFDNMTGLEVTVTTYDPPHCNSRVNGMNSNGVPTRNSDFAPDPYWDNEEEWNSVEQTIKETMKLHGEETTVRPERNVHRIVEKDEEIQTITENWVAKMISGMGICPFTYGSKRAGMPTGNIFYIIDRATHMEELYARFWNEVVRLKKSPEQDISTTLLITPTELFMDNLELFENFGNTLTQSLESFQMNDEFQLIFFHPRYTLRDGKERNSRLNAAANYARRSPWPIINILRTNQVRMAQRGMPSGMVYHQNEETLNAIGVTRLEKMLCQRDWTNIGDHHVDRKCERL